ncbi:COQ9 family protein [Sphingobium sufflavum]|uniref:COQ9 family protein n=1 Tax=Sphingobium sufflavum TaxID=1129547 RepID=UPI001F35CCA7|nr:COQ9 family protein [Sphingobium sufflavum]MCE7795211.1 COQ9 family protein [Sphingobium sufflavum]
MAHADETLDDLRLRLAPMVADNAAFDGWSGKALAATAAQSGTDADVVALAFDGGALAMIDLWFASVDAAMLAALPPETLEPLRVGARIRALVAGRLAILAPHREALRRAQAVLAMPQNLPHAARLGWRAADIMWRAAGDVATDLNHYSKRTTLGAIYAATLIHFVNDESEEWVDTLAFLDRRLAGIARFEKAKARLRPDTDMHFSPARFLGRLRYRA